MQEMCPEVHVIRWMLTISTTKYSLGLVVNFIIASDEKYGQIKVIRCPPNSANQWGKNSSAKLNLNKETSTEANPNVESKGGYGWLVEKRISEIKSWYWTCNSFIVEVRQTWLGLRKVSLIKPTLCSPDTTIAIWTYDLCLMHLINVELPEMISDENVIWVPQLFGSLSQFFWCLCNAEVLRHQTSQSFWFFIH